MQHAADGAQWRVLLAEAPQTVEMTEELVRSIDKVDDHEPKK
jgi:hypothetical protein